MTHILELFDPSKYVANFELDGKDVTVTISRVQGEEIIGEDGEKAKKPVIYFSDWPKPLVIGKRVAKTIWGMYGTDPKAWVGKRITLFPTKEKAFGEMHDVVRVRKGVPSGASRSQQQAPVTIEERTAKAVERIKAGQNKPAVEKAYGLAAGLIAELEAAGKVPLLDALKQARDERLQELDPPAKSRDDLLTEIMLAGTAAFGKSVSKAEVEISVATNGKCATIADLQAKGTDEQLVAVLAHFEALKGC